MIRLSLSESIATVALDRPDARNAFPVEGWHQFRDTLAGLRADTKVVVLTSSTPGMFSAGADLRELASLADHSDRRAPFREAMRAGIEALAALPIPTIAAIDGACFGAAVALILAADLRIASPAARFAVPPAKLGIAYPAEDVARLAARTGQGQAARLLFTGETIDAEEARRIGLIETIADAPAVAATIAANDPSALRLLKSMLRDPRAPGHAAAFEASFGSPAFRAATERYR